jgi:hypothetical protein
MVDDEQQQEELTRLLQHVGKHDEWRQHERPADVPTASHGKPIEVQTT